MMEQIQEQSLKRESRAIEIAVTPTAFAELDDDVKLAVYCANEKKATDIKVLDLREIASFTEFFVLATGNNQRQVQAIADEINEQLKQRLTVFIFESNFFGFPGAHVEAGHIGRYIFFGCEEIEPSKHKRFIESGTERL